MKFVFLQVANAVGAALSQVSGTFDRFVDISKITIEQAIDSAKKIAVDLAIKNGAMQETVEIIDISDTSVTYVAVPTRRIKVKAVGDLEKHEKVADDDESSEKARAEELKSMETLKSYVNTKSINTNSAGINSIDFESESITGSHVDSQSEKTTIHMNPNRPVIDENGEWILNERDVDCICIGAGIMGCGGGGSPYIGRLRLMEALKEGKKIRVVDPMR